MLLNNDILKKDLDSIFDFLGAIAIFKYNNSTFQSIYIDYNYIDDSGYTDIEKIICVKKTKEKINRFYEVIIDNNAYKIKKIERYDDLLQVLYLYKDVKKW